MMISAYHALIVRISGWLEPLALLALRLAGAKVFWESGLTKWNGILQFNTAKYDLFLYEFFCPDPPRPGALQLCDSSTLEYTEGSAIVSLIKALAVMAGDHGDRVAGAAGARLAGPARRARTPGDDAVHPARGVPDLEPLGGIPPCGGRWCCSPWSRAVPVPGRSIACWAWKANAAHEWTLPCQRPRPARDPAQSRPAGGSPAASRR